MSNDPNSKTLNDSQVEQLLGAFYQQEMPAALQDLPSTWPELTQQESSVPMVTPVAAADGSAVRANSVSRGLAVVASMAACLALLVLVNSPGDDTSSNTIQISSGELDASGIVDPEVDTTMEEVEGFQFESDDTTDDSVARPDATSEK